MDSYNNKNSYNDYEEQASNSDVVPSSKFSKEQIITFLKNPKNLLIVVGTAIFLLVAVVKMTSSKKAPTQAQIEKNDNKIPEPTIITNTFIPPSIQEPVAPVAPIAPAPKPLDPSSLPQLPSLELNLFKTITDSAKEQDDEDELAGLDLKKLKAEIEKESKAIAQEDKPSTESLSFDDFAKGQTKEDDLVFKKRKIDPDNPPPPLIEGKGAKGPAADKSSKKMVSDFIFIDSSLDAELSTDSPNEGKKIPDLGNVIAQGRFIDAILESAIDSGIPGTIRAIVSKDVYAEAGRSVLIPKGTRLYGSYSASGARMGRVIITWSRIIRPDGISLGIDSFASDQFGRAGIEGDVDKKYGEIIASALLLSSIPLVATVATQQFTGSRGSQVTTINNGVITTYEDPIISATERFSNDVAKATEQVVTSLIDTAVVVRIPQGTRIKVMVNQDLKLPRYKAITSLNTTVTNSSQ